VLVGCALLAAFGACSKQGQSWVRRGQRLRVLHERAAAVLRKLHVYQRGQLAFFVNPNSGEFEEGQHATG
jgi:hypothetical protein